MTSIDLRLADGFAVTPAAGAEGELPSLTTDFATRWAAILAVAPKATPTPLHVGTR